MVLIHAYIEEYKNFHQQSFPVHHEYQVKYLDSLLTIRYLEPSPVHQMLYHPCHVNGIQLVAGKTGAGKTNLFQLLGEDEEHRTGRSFEDPLGFRDNWASHEVQGSYFFLYALSPSKYYIECKDLKLPQFSQAWKPKLDWQDNRIKSIRIEIQKVEKDAENLARQIEKLNTQGENGKKSAKGLEKRLKEKSELLELLHSQVRRLESDAPDEHLFWTAHFTQTGNGEINILNHKAPQDTLILNCFDKSAFSKQPYPNNRIRGYRAGEWVPRVQAPFQQTSLWNMCRYIREYAQVVESGTLKKQVSLQISNRNFEYVINAPVDEDLALKKLYRFSERAKSSEFERRISEKEMFLHDLWVDYCIYFWKKIKQISIFPKEELDEDGIAYQEALDYMQDKDNFTSPKAAELPNDYSKLSVVDICRMLAQHLDYKGSGLSKGLLWQIWDDIKDVVNLLRKLDDKYFTLTTFEMTVEDMNLPQNQEKIYQLFERMENYEPDDMDLFDHCLLPYHFSRLSSGERQYAMVFGVIYDYLGALKAPKEILDCIVLLDEPDAYQHPELSRQFLNKLLTLCRDLGGEHHFQLFVSTHAPLMLSDVPSDSVLRLGIDSISGDGIVLPATDQRYFGSNIHSIMADGFFLHSTIGEFSRTYLQQVQDRLRDILFRARTHTLSQEERQWVDHQRPILDTIGDQLIRHGFELLLEQIEVLERTGGDAT